MATSRQHSILVLNGPNLNLLGTREPEVYGRDTLGDIKENVIARGGEHGFHIDFQQWNGEGEMVTAIQEARGKRAGIIINPAAYTHTSVALLDALLAVNLPVIEVHLSNPHKREEFRHKSYVSRVARGVICGFGSMGYYLALDAMKHILDVSPAE
jgi:3-dehydroquinate dehydratase-2